MRKIHLYAAPAPSLGRRPAPQLKQVTVRTKSAAGADRSMLAAALTLT